MNSTELLTALRSDSEDAALRNAIEIKRWLSILEVLLPAALDSAAAGNVTMRNAITKVWPLLPKPKAPSPNPGS